MGHLPLLFLLILFSVHNTFTLDHSLLYLIYLLLLSLILDNPPSYTHSYPPAYALIHLCTNTMTE